VESTTTVAVIGLGAMGGRAGATLAADHRVYGYDPDPAARDRAAAAGVLVADSPAAAAQPAALVLLSLPTPEVVRSVLEGLGDPLAGKLIADLSTIDPGTAREAGAVLAGRGARYVDAPILGRPEGCGAWTLAAGGTAADIAALAEVAVGRIAGAVERVGDLGAGSTVKLLNNLMFGAINTVTAEVMDLADRAGVEPARFAQIVAGSGAATVSPLFRSIAPKMAAGRYEPTFSVQLLAKDVRLGVELAARLGAEAPMAGLVRMITDRAVDAGLGDQDTSAVIEVFRGRPPAPDGS
jgi:3-hydroxyisobutyrate dehydrogenase